MTSADKRVVVVPTALEDYPRDRHGYRRFSSPERRRFDYDVRMCLSCGCEIAAPPSRVAHVMRMHVDRCAVASDEERSSFRRMRRWPKRKRTPRAKDQP